MFDPFRSALSFSPIFYWERVCDNFCSGTKCAEAIIFYFVSLQRCTYVDTEYSTTLSWFRINALNVVNDDAVLAVSTGVPHIWHHAG